MAKITDNLKILSQTKTDIKNAIEEKGQPLDGVPFTKYAEKILKIAGGGSGIEDLDDVLTEQDLLIAALEMVFEGGNGDFKENVTYAKQMDTFDTILSGRSVVERDYSEKEMAKLDRILANITQGGIVSG